MTRVCVLTDATSNEYFFPYWYNYYGSRFGYANLFVVTYVGLKSKFQGLELGGLCELPHGYSDSIRKDFISNLVSSLLCSYESIIRVDTDEFLTVDPRFYPDICDFMDKFKGPYITSRGFDVIQLIDEPKLLNQSCQPPLLASRSYAYPNSALCKTSIVSCPTKWSTGFHCCSLYPRFGEVFLLHMKRADIDWQLSWFSNMTAELGKSVDASKYLLDYYLPDNRKIVEYHMGVSGRARISGIESWYRDDHIADYLRSVYYSADHNMYRCSYGHELVLCEIVPEWKLLI